MAKAGQPEGSVEIGIAEQALFQSTKRPGLHESRCYRFSRHRWTRALPSGSTLSCASRRVGRHVVNHDSLCNAYR